MGGIVRLGVQPNGESGVLSLPWTSRCLWLSIGSPTVQSRRRQWRQVKDAINDPVEKNLLGSSFSGALSSSFVNREMGG